jgi:dCMP deaminase
LLYADRAERQGATAYLTRDPCWACALALAAGGVKTIVWPVTYDQAVRQARVMTLLRECGVALRLTA